MASKGGRGAGPRDKVLFGMKYHRKLSLATEDLSYLMERGYAEGAALRLVGDHFQLQKRQRLAVLRSAAGLSERQERLSRKVSDLRGHFLDIDGFNLIILLEAAQSGGLLLRGADGCLRDLASVHGSYKILPETIDLVELLGHYLSQRGVKGVRWWLDSPISNSGRLGSLLRKIALEHHWNWEVNVIPHVDKAVAESHDIVVSTDKVILHRCRRWANLGDEFVATFFPNAWILELPERTHG